MRKDIEVTKLEDLRDGDVFQVGNEEWYWYSNRLSTPGDMFCECHDPISTELIRALGKVSRVVEVSEPPEGYVVKEFNLGDELPTGALARWLDYGRWHEVTCNFKACHGFTYAIPATEQDSCTQTSKLPDAEYEVKGGGYGTTGTSLFLHSSSQEEFTPGEKLRLVRVGKLPEIEGVVVGMGIASLTVACRLTESMRFPVGTRVRIRIEEVQG